MSFSQQIKTSKGDEYYTQAYGVDIIVPYLKAKKFKNIWCPFDKEESEFVKVLTNNGFKVSYSHIETGQDFFETKPQEGTDCIVSNPPFSKRNSLFVRLFELGIPFAMIFNFNGLFDSKQRHELFSKNNFELLIPKGRMQFLNPNSTSVNNPNFQSVYVCSGVLDNQIEFCDMKK